MLDGSWLTMSSQERALFVLVCNSIETIAQNLATVKEVRRLLGCMQAGIMNTKKGW